MGDEKRGLSRRDFLRLTGSAAIGVGVVGYGLPRLVTAEGVAVIPVSKGYLLVDTKKCAGCMSCMLACSLVHEGKENLSLSRIQVIQNPFGGFPDDLAQGQYWLVVSAREPGGDQVLTPHGQVHESGGLIVGTILVENAP